MSSDRKTLFMAIVITALSTAVNSTQVVTAQASLVGPTNVIGFVTLTQSINAGVVSIVGQITGLTPGKHGFHIHELPITNGCDSTGGHFNPYVQTHGPKTNLIQSRHSGDFGNIVADARGNANLNIVDTQISLLPRNGLSNNVVVGRSFVVHASEDDLGRGGNSASLTNGNAGARLACGTIQLV